MEVWGTRHLPQDICQEFTGGAAGLWHERVSVEKWIPGTAVSAPDTIYGINPTRFSARQEDKEIKGGLSTVGTGITWQEMKHALSIEIIPEIGPVPD